MNSEIEQALSVCDAIIDKLADDIIANFETYRKALRYVKEQKVYTSGRLHTEILNEITNRIRSKALDSLTKEVKK